MVLIFMISFPVFVVSRVRVHYVSCSSKSFSCLIVLFCSQIQIEIYEAVRSCYS